MFDKVAEFVKKQFTISNLIKVAAGLVIILILGMFSFWVKAKVGSHTVQSKITKNLSAETREAQILVRSNTLNERTGSVKATLKYQEWDVQGEALEPRLITLEGNRVQLVTAAITLPKELGRLKDKKLLLFLKLITGVGGESRELKAVKPGGIPEAYKIGPGTYTAEQQIWENIWKQILDKEGKLIEELQVITLPVSKSFFLPGTTFNLTLDSSGEVQIETRYPSYAVTGE